MDRDLIIDKFSPFPQICTDRLTMRRIETRDAADMFEYSCDADVTKYLTWEPHRNLQFTKKYIKRVERAYEGFTFFDFALVLNDSGKMIGTCGFTSISCENRACEIGYVMNPRYRGYGLMTEACESLLDFAFNTLGAGYVFARCMPENTASERVMSRLGMMYHDRISRAGIKNRRYYDVLEYRVTRERYFLRQQGINNSI